MKPRYVIFHSMQFDHLWAIYQADNHFTVKEPETNFCRLYPNDPMNPTAEDILNERLKNFTVIYPHTDSDKKILTDLMEEYSLLKYKEAADKAWWAGYSTVTENPELRKEAFMKSLK